MTLTSHLRKLGACQEAIDWVGDKSLAEAWATCQRADWMFWFLKRSDYDRKALNGVLIDTMAIALEAARPASCREAYWPAIEAAHLQVAEAIRTGIGLTEADAAADAADAAYAAAAARVGARAAAAAADAAICDSIRRHFPTTPTLR